MFNFSCFCAKDDASDSLFYNDDHERKRAEMLMAGAACEQRHVFSATAVSLRLADDELKFTWRSRLSKQAHVGSFNVSAVETAEPKGAKGLRFGGAGNLTLFDGAFESPEVRDSWATAVSELLQRSRRRILREDAANAVLEQAAHSSAAAALASAEAAAESQEAATLKRLSQEAAHERRKERSDSLRKKCVSTPPQLHRGAAPHASRC